MAKAILDLDTIGDLDNGAARLVVNEAIATAVADFDDRGGDKKPRKVTITLTLELTDIGPVISVEAKASVPAYHTGGTVAKVQRAGSETQLVFQQHDPANPDQETMDFNEHEKGGE